MNISSLLQFESMHYHGAQTQSMIINRFVANSLRVFIEDFYQRIAPSFMLIISCRRPSPMNFYRNIMQLLYESVDTMILQLVHHNHSQPQRLDGLRLHNLLLVDSLQALLDIEIHTYTTQHDASKYYFIFLQQRDALIPADMLGVFEYCWRHQLINCNVMTQSSRGEVIMHTYFPYEALHCSTVVQRQINRFLGSAWQHGDYFPAKLHNLHQCPLQVLQRAVSPFLGLEERLLQLLARRMNFSIRLVHHNQSVQLWTEQQVLQLLQQRHAHLAIGYLRKRMRHAGNLSAVFPHYSSRLECCLLLSAYNLNSFDILRFPFQPLTWLWQLLYVNWLGFTLLIRAMYSALFYHLLRQQVHQRLPRTLAELGEGSYTAVMNRITALDVREVSSLQALFGNMHTIVIGSELERDVIQQLDARVQQLQQEHPRIFAVLSRQTLLHVAEETHKPGAYYVLPQHVLDQQLAIYLQKDSHLLHQFDELIMAIQAVGLINYWAGQLGSERYFRSTFMLSDRRLRQPDLWAIYVIAGICYALATLVFLAELGLARWRRSN
ncbi:hypothetical protein KR093_006041 [Drosophila rubida]|uniref:Putative ionotropic receptor ligand binding domain-containing protein n=1 Tax=Drosophila rubida TaxID=30044 RepID=A0AAD4PRS5_9MUSC|nr:hypothetical protein KR093_006041 [Drosophila rubida]